MSLFKGIGAALGMGGGRKRGHGMKTPEWNPGRISARADDRPQSGPISTIAQRMGVGRARSASISSSAKDWKSGNMPGRRLGQRKGLFDKAANRFSK